MIKEKILIVEDDQDFVNLVRDILLRENFSVISASSAEDAIRKIRKSKPGLILLDLLLPGIDGVEFCKKLKQDKGTKQIPVIMLTSKRAESDMVTGLEVGADDYLTKPFRPRELVARVRAVLRRIRDHDEPVKVLAWGELQINIDKHTVLVKGRHIDLTPNEFDLLHLLLKRRGEVLSRDFLMQSIWGYEYFGTTRTVDMTVARLRRKLGEAAQQIETVEGVGYRFNDEETES